MEISLFDAFVHTSQYLTLIPSTKNVFLESPEIMVRFFRADSAFLLSVQKGERVAVLNHFGSIQATTEELLDAFEANAKEVMQSGYFYTTVKSFGGNEYGFILLPLEFDNIVNTVLVSGFVDVLDFSKDALNSYLAVSGLISSTYQKQRSESKNKMVLEMAGEGIFGLDRDGRHSFVNEAAARMLGFSTEELLGKNSHSTWHHHHRDGREYDNHECPVFRVLNGQLERASGEDYFLRKDNSGFEVELVATPIKEDGVITGVVVIFRDITEQKILQKKLQELNNSLEAKVEEEVRKNREKDVILIKQARLAAVGEMISNIAHQWRQPLSGLMAAKDLLVVDYFDNALTKESVEQYSEQTTQTLRYLSKTIDDFRHFFKSSDEIKPFDVIAAIKTAASIALPSLNYRNIKLLFELQDEILCAVGFESEFQQVVINIIGNAKDAIIASRTEGLIIIKAEKVDDFVRTTIEDNGGGIPEGVMDKIFDPYFTTKFKSQGTGLGLYMAKTIIETNMHGKISVANGEKGAIFTIDLFHNQFPPTEESQQLFDIEYKEEFED